MREKTYHLYLNEEERSQSDTITHCTEEQFSRSGTIYRRSR